MIGYDKVPSDEDGQFCSLLIPTVGNLRSCVPPGVIGKSRTVWNCSHRLSPSGLGSMSNQRGVWNRIPVSYNL